MGSNTKRIKHQANLINSVLETAIVTKFNSFIIILNITQKKYNEIVMHLIVLIEDLLILFFKST